VLDTLVFLYHLSADNVGGYKYFIPTGFNNLKRRIIITSIFAFPSRRDGMFVAQGFNPGLNEIRFDIAPRISEDRALNDLARNAHTLINVRIVTCREQFALR
jgi:hypothetical protein